MANEKRKMVDKTPHEKCEEFAIENNLNEGQKNYLIGCEMMVADLENHVKQCEQEFLHYKKMAEYSRKQLDLSSTRLNHERISLEHTKDGYRG
jgi:hypothetical protein